MNWLAVSIVASVVLTIVLNLVIRLWPGGAERGTRRLDHWVQRQDAAEFGDGPNRVRVVVPWKAMLLGSIVLTVLLNVVLRLA